MNFIAPWRRAQRVSLPARRRELFDPLRCPIPQLNTNGSQEETKPFGQYQVRSHRALPTLPAPNYLNELPGNRNAKSKYFADERHQEAALFWPAPWRRSFQPSTPEYRVKDPG
jgi:hypothetical protein